MSLKEQAYDSTRNFVVALDGPSAAGKGLIGSMLSKEFNLRYIQSSIVYRGLAYLCIKKKISSNEIDKVIKLSASKNIIKLIEGVDLNLEEIGQFASKISTIPEVRKNLGKYLLELIKETARIIMEGRDIGTLIVPNADLKIFITATPKIRALRRYKQLQASTKDCILSDILDQIKLRDLRDSSRKSAPLKAASDALVIDTSNLSPEEVIQKIKNSLAK